MANEKLPIPLFIKSYNGWNRAAGIRVEGTTYVLDDRTNNPGYFKKVYDYMTSEGN